MAVIETLPAAQLIHRYSFSEAQGTTNLVDSVGGANGAVYGAANASLLNGQLTLPGGTANANGTFNPAAAYVDLPSGMISGLTNVSFEAWVTWNDQSTNSWERIFDFGTSVGGQGLQNGGVSYLLLTPQSGNGVRAELRPPEERPDEILETGAPLPVGVAACVAVVYNYSLHDFRIFTNGVLAASMTTTVPLSSISDLNDWLGRSQFLDPFFNGSLDEFRIWNGALTAAQIAQNYAAGPNVVPIPITLQAQLSGKNITLSWTGGSLLESANVAGPDTPVNGNPSSPYTVVPAGPRKFYRVQASP